MSVRIGLGIANFSFSSPAPFWDWIDTLEASGVDSVWFTERLVSRFDHPEPVTTMAMVAGRTRRLKVGVNATVLPLRDPLVLAKELASLDYFSGGRLLPVYGVGAGNAPEFAATGRDTKGRGRRADEMLEIMARLWREDGVTYQGKHFTYTDVSISPKPVQQPLPMWIGGSSDAAIRRTARLGDGWLAGVQAPEQVAPVVAKIRRASAEAGRPIDPDHYGAGFSFRFGSMDDPIVERSVAAFSRIGARIDADRLMAVGDTGAIIERCREYHAAGISKFVMRPLAVDDADTMLQTRRLIEEVMPVVHTWPNATVATADEEPDAVS